MRAEQVAVSITRQYDTLYKVLQLMNAMMMDQLCSDGLATDHIVHQLFAFDPTCQVHLREYAAKHASNTASAAPSSPAKQQDGQISTEQTEAEDEFVPASLLARPFKPWPQPSSKQWASTVMVANKATELNTWLTSPAQQARTNTPRLLELQDYLLHYTALLIGSLVTSAYCFCAYCSNSYDT